MFSTSSSELNNNNREPLAALACVLRTAEPYHKWLHMKSSCRCHVAGERAVMWYCVTTTVPCTLISQAGEKGSVVSTEMQEAKVSIMRLKSCPTLHGEAQETAALPSSNNSHVPAYAPRYLSVPGEQQLNAGIKLMGLVWECRHHIYADARCLKRVICLAFIPLFWITLKCHFWRQTSGFWKSACRSSAWRQDAADQLLPTRQWLQLLLNSCSQCRAAWFDSHHVGPEPYPYWSTIPSLSLNMK